MWTKYLRMLQIDQCCIEVSFEYRNRNWFHVKSIFSLQYVRDGNIWRCFVKITEIQYFSINSQKLELDSCPVTYLFRTSIWNLIILDISHCGSTKFFVVCVPVNSTVRIINSKLFCCFIEEVFGSFQILIGFINKTLKNTVYISNCNMSSKSVFYDKRYSLR